MPKKKDKAEAPAAEAPAECKHERAYIAAAGKDRTLVQICPDCYARQPEKSGAKPSPRPMPLGQVERMTAQLDRLKMKAAKVERQIKAAGPQSAAGRSLQIQLDHANWEMKHAKRRLANAEQRAGK